MAPIGCVPADINQDGYQDILVYYWGRSPVVFLNSAEGGAPGADQFLARELVDPMAVWNTTALNVADVDGDGNLDVLVGNYFPDGARVLDPSAEDDGRMEMQHSMGNAKNAGLNRVFLGSDAGVGEMPSFEDASVSLPSNSAASWTLAFGLQDLTKNGLPDMYVANDFGPDQLLVNTSTPGRVRLEEVRGSRDFTTPKSKVLGHDSFKGMGVAFSYEPDSSLPRILVSNITSPWALHESNFAFYPTGSPEDLLKGKVPYEDRSSSIGFAHSGWSWDLKAVDLMNSGRDDVVQATGFIKGDRNLWPRLQETAMGNDLILSDADFAWFRIEQGDDISGHEPDRLWREDTDGTMVDVGEEVGFDADDVSRGVAPGDFNDDGRRDFLVAGEWGDSHAYINESEVLGDAVTIDVLHDTPGRPTPAIGAEVVLRSGARSKTAQLYPANGHSGVADSSLHFGLPENWDEANLVAEVRWFANGEVHEQVRPVRVGRQTIVLDENR